MNVIGFGESSVDYVYVVSELPTGHASKLPILDSFTSFGGQVATTLAACASLGLTAAYLGPVGDDENGRRLLERLRSCGVDTSQTLVRNAPTRFAVILVHQQTGERVVLWRRDAGLNVDLEEVASMTLPPAVVAHVDATDPRASVELARRAAAAGLRVTCDVDAVTPLTAELLEAVTIPIVAAHVPQLLTGDHDTERALRAMRRPHQPIVCVTRGDRGAAAVADDAFIDVPALSVQAVDTTSAGDVFRGAFIYGLVQAWPTERTMRFANAAASIACTRRGAIDSVPTLDEVFAVTTT